MYRVHMLPTKPTKDATTEEPGGRPTKSIEDSLVLLQALRQSRQTWLTSAFKKFSTKSRGGKGNEIWQPPHTIRFRGKCDLEIGPHVFYSTSVYEVTYQPYQAPTPVPCYAAGQKYPGWPSGPYTYTSAPQTPSTSQTAIAQVYAPSTPAVVSSIKGAVPITNDLISQVNTAAVTNPTLANLLGLAASGSATPEQLQTLGVTIQSLAETALKSTNSSTSAPTVASTSTPLSKPTTAPQTQSPVSPPMFQPPSSAQTPKLSSNPSQPPVLSLRPSQVSSPNSSSGQGNTGSHDSVLQRSSQSPQMQTINKDPDVVIEFYENSYDRWTLPKDLVLYERVKRWDGNSNLADIIFSTILPFEDSKDRPLAVVQTPSSSAEAVVDPQQAKNTVHPITLRFFNVPPAIWNLFSKAAGDEERTKRVRDAIDSQLDKAAPRVYLQHQIAEGALLTQLQTSLNDRYPTKSIRPTVPTVNTTKAKRRASAANKKNTERSPGEVPLPKRKRTTPSKKPESKIGRCEGCLQNPVSLVPETPYCPTCDKAKKSKVSFMTAEATPSSSQQKCSSSPSKSSTQSTSACDAKQAATPPVQAPYPSYPSVQNYFAWQKQPQYIYQYQPQSQSQGHPSQTSVQSLSPSGAGQTSANQQTSNTIQLPGQLPQAAQNTPSQQQVTPSEVGATPSSLKVDSKQQTLKKNDLPALE